MEASSRSSRRSPNGFVSGASHPTSASSTPHSLEKLMTEERKEEDGGDEREKGGGQERESGRGKGKREERAEKRKRRRKGGGGGRGREGRKKREERRGWGTHLGKWKGERGEGPTIQADKKIGAEKEKNSRLDNRGRQENLHEHTRRPSPQNTQEPSSIRPVEPNRLHANQV